MSERKMTEHGPNIIVFNASRTYGVNLVECLIEAVTNKAYFLSRHGQYTAEAAVYQKQVDYSVERLRDFILQLYDKAYPPQWTYNDLPRTQLEPQK